MQITCSSSGCTLYFITGILHLYFDMITFDDVMQFCEQRNHLAPYLDDVMISEMIMANESGLCLQWPANETNLGIWFGLSAKYIDPNLIWYYAYGPEAETFNWNPGYPIETMTCAAMNATDLEWYTEECEEELWVMCQEIPEELTQTSSTEPYNNTVLNMSTANTTPAPENNPSGSGQTTSTGSYNSSVFNISTVNTTPASENVTEGLAQTTSDLSNFSVSNVSTINTTPFLENITDVNQTFVESIPTEWTYDTTTSEFTPILSETINETSSYVILMTSENGQSLYSGENTDDTNSSIQLPVDILTTTFQMASFTDITPTSSYHLPLGVIQTSHESSSETTQTTELIESSPKPTTKKTIPNEAGGGVDENIREYLRKQRDESDVDIRPSAVAIGVTAACVISCIVFAIILMDVGKFYRDFKGMKRNLIDRWKREKAKVETTHF